MSKLTRDGTAEPVSRDQILRRERGQRIIHFPCSAADNEQDWQPCPVVRAIHTNIALHTHNVVVNTIYIYIRRQCKSKHTTATWKALRAACKEVRAAIDKGIEAHLEEYVAELETLLRHRDMRGLYKHLKMTAGLGGRKTEGQQAIKDENGNLLRDKRDILRRWERFFGNLLNTKSPTLQPNHHPSSRRYSSGGRHRSRRRPGQGRKSRSQYHSRQSQRTRRRRRQSGRWPTGKRRALTHSQ